MEGSKNHEFFVPRQTMNFLCLDLVIRSSKKCFFESIATTSTVLEKSPKEEKKREASKGLQIVVAGLVE
ncbi:hypothetical protein Sjap_022693 [Stephania japonica]|uniref:Uncharacterized protein n=1 Tax=Stephania japonica TaxID=461633 RepID=A0AAP0EPV8_9MAGN